MRSTRSHVSHNILSDVANVAYISGGYSVSGQNSVGFTFRNNLPRQAVIPLRILIKQ